MVARFLWTTAMSALLAALAHPLAAQAPALPALARPWATGLTGTLVFHSDLAGPDNPMGRSRIYTLDLARGVVSVLTRGREWRDENPRWSPDGKRIAFKSNRAGADGARSGTGRSDYDLYVMDADGQGVIRITDHPANDHDPVWMPDGQSLIFSSERDSRGDLYRVWLADRRVERLTQNFVGRAIMPAVSPDGRSVAFAAQSFNRLNFWSFQVHVLDLATGRTRALAATAGSCWPSWSPDGRSLAHVLLDREPSVLRISSSDGRPIGAVPGDARLWHYYPEWSPDGRLIALSVSPAHHDGEDWDLAVASPDNPSAYRRLTTGPGNDRNPDWRP